VSVPPGNYKLTVVGESYEETIRVPSSSDSFDVIITLPEEAIRYIEASIADETPTLCKVGTLDCATPACVMSQAIYEAERDNCKLALQYLRIIHCRNTKAQKVLQSWGQTNVCNYLKSRRKTGGV